MCTDPEASVRRVKRRKAFRRFRKIQARLMPSLRVPDERDTLRARQARVDILEGSGRITDLAPEPEVAFYHRDGYDPEEHLTARMHNRLEQYLEERAEEESRLLDEPHTA